MSGANDAAVGVAVGELARMGVEAAQMLRDQYRKNLEEHQRRQQAQVDAARAMRRRYLEGKSTAQTDLAGWEVAGQDATLAFVAGMLERSRQELGAGLENAVSAPEKQEALELQSRLDTLAAQLVEQEPAALFQEVAAAREVVAAWNKKLRRVKPAQSQDAETSQEMSLPELAQMALEAIAGLRKELGPAMGLDAGFSAELNSIQDRLNQLEGMVQTQPATVVQGMALLEERLRKTVRQLGRSQANAALEAQKVREIVGEATAALQTVAEQRTQRALAAEARLGLKRLANLLAASTLDLGALEALGEDARALLEKAEKNAEEEAVQRHIQGQVAEVLATLGYKVSSATNASGGESLVAPLSGDVGVQMQVDRLGNFTSEMVALHEGAREVDEAQQERMCDLMDSIFDGLRARKLVVREKKRKNLKSGRDTLPVVSVTQRAEGAREQDLAEAQTLTRTLD